MCDQRSDHHWKGCKQSVDHYRESVWLVKWEVVVGTLYVKSVGTLQQVL